MKITVLAALLLLSGPWVLADLIYDVTFEGGAFVPGEICPTGSPPLFPQYQEGLGYSGIEDSSLFGSQVADLGWLLFDPGLSYASGIHVISWDASVDAFDPTTGWPGIVVNIYGTDISVANGSFILNGTNYSTGGFSYGSVLQYQVTLDLDAHTTSFYINDVPYVSMEAIGDSSLLSSIVLQHPANNNALVDNFRWEVVPEPSSIILLLCGGCILAGARRRLAGA